ncbi:MAG: CPBP family intramembrane metalloprotease, partial [Planctomycetota bacterium]|nr:CPBP family intramembrane metalloprotease [Planctomycetota bacterium]
IGKFIYVYALLSVVAILALIGVSIFERDLRSETSRIREEYHKRLERIDARFKERFSLRGGRESGEWEVVFLPVGVVFCGGVAALVYGLWRLFRGKELLSHNQKRGGSPPWRADAGLRLLILFFFSSSFVQFLMVIFSFFSGSSIYSVTEHLVAEVLAKTILFGLALSLFAKEYNASRENLGLTVDGKCVAYSFFLFFFSFFPVLLLSLGWSSLVQRLGGEIEANPAVYILLAASDGRLGMHAFYLTLALAVLVAPFAEEFIFRTILFSAFRSHFRFLPSAVFSSLVFAALHPTVAGFAPLLLLSLFLCYLYERTSSLFSVALMHSVHNAFQIAVVVLVYRSV